MKNRKKDESMLAEFVSLISEFYDEEIKSGRMTEDEFYAPEPMDEECFEKQDRIVVKILSKQRGIKYDRQNLHSKRFESLKPHYYRIRV